MENEGPSTKGAKNRYFQMARHHLHDLGSTNKNLNKNNFFSFSQNESTVFLLLCHLQKKCLWAKQKGNTSLLMKLNKKRFLQIANFSSLILLSKQSFSDFRAAC